MKQYFEQNTLPSSVCECSDDYGLSRSTRESTSIERQREIIQQWAGSNNHTVVGWASDIDVSGSLDPFDTPELGKWLSDRAPEWDIVAAWKLDRLGRNAIQLNKLFGWCKEGSAAR